MASLKSRYTMILLPVLIGAVAGCAEYRECGLGGCPSDRKITANVQARLSEYPDLGPPESINVQTLNHVVYLDGEVSYGLAKENAESIAKQVPGVTRVENNIAVSY